MVAMVLSLSLTMWSSTRLVEIDSVGDNLKAHFLTPSCGITMAPPPAKLMTGTFSLPAASTTAKEVGVVDDPMIRSTLSSAIKRMALLAAVLVSEASFKMMNFAF